jgi:hypothetical protein
MTSGRSEDRRIKEREKQKNNSTERAEEMKESKDQKRRKGIHKLIN